MGFRKISLFITSYQATAAFFPLIPDSRRFRQLQFVAAFNIIQPFHSIIISRQVLFIHAPVLPGDEKWLCSLQFALQPVYNFRLYDMLSETRAYELFKIIMYNEASALSV